MHSPKNNSDVTKVIYSKLVNKKDDGSCKFVMKCYRFFPFIQMNSHVNILSKNIYMHIHIHMSVCFCACVLEMFENIKGDYNSQHFI